MKINDLKKLGQEEEVEQLRELFFSELDALMARYAFLTRRSSVGGEDAERLTMSLQVEWVAASAELYGMERGEFLTAAANAFDLAVDDNAEEEDPPASGPVATPPTLAIVPKEDP